MRIRYKTGQVRNVPKVRARALIRAGAASPIDGIYRTRDMRAAAPTAPRIQEQESEIQKLRTDYQDLYGKRPFMGWDEDTLRKKIDEALDE